MDRYRRLRKEANEACTFRGHNMSTWTRLHFDQRLDSKQMWRSKIVEESECIVCRMTVVINTMPAPNEIDIGGQAVALTCYDGKEILK